MRVMLYPYWPQGTYWFDDVSLVEAGADPGFAARVAAKAEGREAEAKRKRDAEVAEARATIQFAAKALERFRADVGRYPTTAEGLAALATRPDGLEAWAGPYLGELDVDPWGAPYRYRSPGTRRAASFDLESWGPDGVEGGGDDVGAE
jgi:type II secretion system protein G